MDNTLLHIRQAKDDIETLDALAGRVMSRQQVAGMILSAALEAVRKNELKLSFPPVFTVGEDTGTTLALNERAIKPRR